MKHTSTQAVFDYWNRQRKNRPAPERADIDPAEIRHALSDTFMLAADFVDLVRFRLAGTRVCALFAREIKGEIFTALWSEASQPTIGELLNIVVGERHGVVAGLTASTADGAKAELEMLLLPLAHGGPGRIRALGVLAPLVTPYWIGATPVTELELGTVRHLGPEVEGGRGPLLVPALDPIQIRHGFVVYSGGRENPPDQEAG